MDKINIEGTPKTPAIKLDPEAGIIEISGRSIPENSIEFYKPVMDWLNEYAENAKSETAVNIILEYFNTSSSKCILDVFKKIEGIQKSGSSEMIINWHYEEDDEDMLEAGEEFAECVSVPFDFIALSN